MEEKIRYIEVRKIYARVPADIFSDLERLGMMKNIDEIISKLLLGEIERMRTEELKNGRQPFR